MRVESETFRVFVVARSAGLVRSACLLTGNEGTAQDLVQTALFQTWRRWDQVRNKEDPEGYVRRVIMATFLSWRRRRWRYFDDLSETDTARILDCSVGTVKSQAARALAQLRDSSDLSGLWGQEART